MIVDIKVSVKKDGKVYAGDKHIGSVEAYEGSRTGYRRGYCVGQVACTKWRAEDVTGKRVPSGYDMGAERGWARRADAVAALVEHVASAETQGSGADA